PRDPDAVIAPPPRVRWAHAGGLGSLQVVREGVRSSHLVGEPTATFRVGGAAAAYGRPGPRLPGASLLVVSHDVEDGPLHFAMERSDEAAPWTYAVVDRDGWIVEAGRIPSCVRCHQEAPGDEIFGPPAAPPPADL